MLYVQMLIPWYNPSSKPSCALPEPRGRRALEQLPTQGFHPTLGHGKIDTWPGLGKEIRENESSSETSTAFIISGKDRELCTAELPMARQRNQSWNQTMFESLVPNLKQGNVLKSRQENWIGILSSVPALSCSLWAWENINSMPWFSRATQGWDGSHMRHTSSKMQIFVLLVQPARGELDWCYFPSCSVGSRHQAHGNSY